MVVGFVGKAGSGKSTAAERFERFGAEIISLDKLGHDALEEEKKQMVDSFGKSILTCDKVQRRSSKTANSCKNWMKYFTRLLDERH